MNKLRVALYGIKGSGLAALALYLDDYGFCVFGYDKGESLFTETRLKERGIKIINFEDLEADKEVPFDLLIYSSAYKDSEIIEKLKNYSCCFEYHEFLSFLLRDKRMIGVSGTHGKTTLVSLIDQMFERKLDLIEGDGYGRGRGKEEIITECCEYRDHFLAYNPYYAVITSIELDHTDYFHSYQDYLESFINFAKRAKKVMVYDIYSSYFKDAIRVGTLEHSDYRYVIKMKDRKGFIVDIYTPKKIYKNLHLPFYGEHMIKLFTFALAIGLEEGKDDRRLINNLLGYKPARRRAEISRYEDYIIVDDYAHQPSQIENIYSLAAQIAPTYKKVVIFLPDRLSRLQDFYHEFKRALSLFDEAFVVNKDPQKEPLINQLTRESKIKIYKKESLEAISQAIYLVLSSKKIDDIVSDIKEIRDNKTPR